ncbi:MAG: hypothetical protein RLZZ299_554 [Pseudomonadota bacterium]
MSWVSVALSLLLAVRAEDARGGVAGARPPPQETAPETPLGPEDRVRVDDPDWPGAVASSATGAVLDAPPPPGVRWRVERAPEVDALPDAALPWAAQEARAAMATDPWWPEGGRGVRVAVFDVQWYGADLADAALGDVVTHDCQAHRSCEPPIDTLRPRYAWEGGGHGIACAEVIRALAPAAELHLVRVNGATTLENAVDWAIREDIDIVSMSMSFFHDSFHDGSGPVSASAARLAAAGILLVTSAGNYATEHWDGAWSDPDGDGRMDFPWGGTWWGADVSAGTTTFQLAWDEYARCGRTDLALEVRDPQGHVLARSDARQDPDADSCAPYERATLRVPEATTAWVRVLRRAGAAHGRVSLWARGADAHHVTPGAFADPASGPTPLVVGAVRAVGYAANAAEFFSSWGTSHGGLARPDVAGPDGLSSSVYGGIGFYGTSAATPAVAAAAALLLAEDPSGGPLGVAERLRAETVSGTRADEPARAARLGAGRVRLGPPDGTLPRPCGGDGSAACVVAPWMLVTLRRRGRRRP